MFGIFKRHAKAPRWEQLTDTQKRYATHRLVKAVKAMAGSRYKVVSGTDVFNREQGVTETQGEDEILSAYRRGRMLSLTRNAARNSPTFNGILKQFDLNAVGTCGGKVILDFDNAEPIRDAFAEWAREADFFDGLNLNAMLKLILKTYIIGGDCVAVYDDGLFEDSGRLLLFEPDEIGDTTAEALATHYGKLARQSQGRVYNPNGRFIGCIVSRSQRGRETFDPSKAFFLTRNPDESLFDSCWFMPRNVFRVA